MGRSMGMTTNTNSTSLDALGYAKAACETMMRKFRAADLPPKGHFHYHQGVFLSGMMETWKESGPILSRIALLPHKSVVSRPRITLLR